MQGTDCRESVERIQYIWRPAVGNGLENFNEEVLRHYFQSFAGNALFKNTICMITDIYIRYIDAGSCSLYHDEFWGVFNITLQHMESCAYD